jgi:hypothetical protein
MVFQVREELSRQLNLGGPEDALPMIGWEPNIEPAKGAGVNGRAAVLSCPDNLHPSCSQAVELILEATDAAFQATCHAQA